MTERSEDEHGVAPHVPGWVHRHGYRLLVLSLLATFLACFAVAEALRLPLLSDSGLARPPSQVPTAAIGLALLIGDVVLPVPSSAVMVAQGTAYGLVLGALLGWLGSTGARSWPTPSAAPAAAGSTGWLPRRNSAAPPTWSAGMVSGPSR